MDTWSVHLSLLDVARHLDANIPVRIVPCTGPSRGLQGSALVGYHIRLDDEAGHKRSGLVVSYDSAAGEVSKGS